MTKKKDAPLIPSEQIEKALKEYWDSWLPTVEECTKGLVQMLNFAVYLKALGYSNEGIKSITKMNDHDLDYILVRPGAMELIAKLQSLAIVSSPVERFRTLVNEAISVLEELMMGADRDSTRLAAAQTVIERSLGKVTQAVEVKADSPLTKLLEKLTESASIETSGKSLKSDQDAPLILEDNSDS